MNNLSGDGVKKLIVLGLLVVVAYLLLSSSDHLAVQEEQDSLSFSNTQTWDTYLYSLRNNKVVLVPDLFILPPPPENSSKETADEIKLLHKLEKARTESDIEQIKKEVFQEEITFNGNLYVDLISEEERPQTNLLFTATLSELLSHIIYQKDHFDRVRPSKLDPTLTTVIDVPAYPAYPSGHATEARFFALLFSELDPDNKDEYMNNGNQIGYNREIAGLHYVSDTVAGQTLAEEFFKILKETDWYIIQIELAKAEW